MTYECGLPFVPFFDSDIVVSPPEINLGEVLRSLELVDKLGDEGERVVIPNHMLIQILIVLHHPLPTIFLWHEEYG